MATINSDSRSVLDDPLKAPAIGMTDSIHGDDFLLESPRKDASATHDRAERDASNPDEEEEDLETLADEENEWEDVDDEEHMSLYEDLLDGTDHEGDELGQGTEEDNGKLYGENYELMYILRKTLKHSHQRSPKISASDCAL